MTGNEFYDNEWQRKINNDLNRIENKDYVDIIKGFNNYMISGNVMISTRRNYINKIVMFINNLDTSIREIGFIDYVNFITQFNDKTSSYQVQIYTALKNFSEFLYKSQITKENYMDKVKRPKTRESIETKQKREKGYLNKKEVEKLILSAKCGTSKYKTKTESMVCDRDYTMTMLMFGTGLRCSALCKLDVSDIDFEKKMIQITEKRGKIRTCILSDQLIDVLYKWLKIREKFVNKETDDALFLSVNGNRLNSDSVRKIIGKRGEGIKDIKITPHKLRATYGTLIYEKTGDIYLTQQCMGHSNVQTTMLYVRGQEEKAQRQAAEIMSEVLF